MSFTQHRATRLAVAFASTAVAVSGLIAAGQMRGGSASTPSASDICVTVPGIVVHGQMVYPGGLYCVPFPLASQPM